MTDRRRDAALTWLTYAAGAIAIGAVIAVGAARGWSVERDHFWIRASAWCALIALSLSLAVSPIGRALERSGRVSRKRITALRRALGITTAALASTHATLALTTYLREAWHHILAVSWLRSGFVALVILLALWATSYPALVRRAKIKLWKPLHRLAYVAFALALHHALLSPLAPRLWLVVVGAVVLGLGVIRWLPWSRPTR